MTIALILIGWIAWVSVVALLIVWGRPHPPSIPDYKDENGVEWREAEFVGWRDGHKVFKVQDGKAKLP
jgi:hypothetical protein